MRPRVSRVSGGSSCRATPRGSPELNHQPGRARTFESPPRRFTESPGCSLSPRGSVFLRRAQSVADRLPDVCVQFLSSIRCTTDVLCELDSRTLAWVAPTLTPTPVPGPCGNGIV